MLQFEPMIVDLETKRQARRDAELLALCDQAADAARNLKGRPELVAMALRYVADELATEGRFRT